VKYLSSAVNPNQHSLGSVVQSLRSDWLIFVGATQERKMFLSEHRT